MKKKTDYSQVNDPWLSVPGGVTTKPDAQEAVSAAKRLYRKAMGKPFRGTFKITSGNRYNWIRRNVFSVNPGGHHFGAWRDLVHDISHYAHQRLHPDSPAHGSIHRTLERELAIYVIESGWLTGKLKSKAVPKAKPTGDQKRLLEGARIAERIKSWEAKERRAQNALKKLRKTPAYKTFLAQKGT